MNHHPRPHFHTLLSCYAKPLSKPSDHLVHKAESRLLQVNSRPSRSSGEPELWCDKRSSLPCLLTGTDCIPLFLELEVKLCGLHDSDKHYRKTSPSEDNL